MIEFFLVIIVIGILLAVAIPKYLNIRDQARNSVARAMTGALWGSIQLNHANYLLRNIDYTIKDIVEGVRQPNAVLEYAPASLWVDIFGRTYTWLYTGHEGANMAIIKEQF